MMLKSSYDKMQRSLLFRFANFDPINVALPVHIAILSSVAFYDSIPTNGSSKYLFVLTVASSLSRRLH